MPRRRIGLSAVVLSAVAVAPVVLGGPAAVARPTVSPVRAVVVLRAGVLAPVSAPGVRVVGQLHSLGMEVVRATPEALRGLASDPRVAGVSPDRGMHVTGYYGHHHDDAADGNGVLAAQALGGEAGEPGTGAGVNVALIDTGVSDTPALNRLSGRLVDGVDVSRLRSGGAARTSGRFTDGYGHGTFLASLIAGGEVLGSGDRGIGVAPAAHVVVVKVADSAGATSLSQVLAGMDWVASHASALQVVNLSLAQDRPTGRSYGADPLTAGVEHLRSSGVLVVAAAGNTPGQVGDPGMDPQSLTVGAVELHGSKARVTNFSGSGSVDGVVKPDVVAPGRHVLGVIDPTSTIARQHPEAFHTDGLFVGSGTSESTALTSGVAAAYLSHHPGSSPLQTKTALRTGAQSLCSWGSGAGLVTVDGRGSSCDRHKNRSGVDVQQNPTGEAGFDAAAWQGNAWLNGSWEKWLASSWSASSWSASSWSASSWSASSWSASSWSASSWSASSWSASSWSASSWSASSWSASSWSTAGWGDGS